MNGRLPGPDAGSVLPPQPTARVCFREMSTADLDLMASLLGDPAVMEHYPRPKSRQEALAWIEWNERNLSATT